MNEGCIACGSTGQKLFVHKNGHDILQCPDCRLLFVHPIPSAEKIAALYNRDDRERFKPGGGRWRGLDRRIIARWIRRRTGGGRMLEVGCNQGDLLVAAGSVGGLEAFGFDLDRLALIYARSRGAAVALGSLEKAPFAPETFDVVVAWHVLEHLCDPIEGMRMIRQLLRPGGWMVTCFPSPEHPKARLAGKKWHYFNPPFHLWYFSRSSFAQLCERSGLQLTYSSLFHYHAHMTALARRV